MNKFRPSLLLFALGALTACGGPKDFKVKIDSESIGTQRLTVVYTLPDGHRAVVEPTAVDGHTEFTGHASEPSVVEVFTSSGARLVTFTALNGEKISISFDADGTPVITGAAHQSTDTVTAASAADTLRFTSPRVIVDRDSSEVWPAEGTWVFTSSGKERSKAVMDTIRAHGKKVRDVFVGTDIDLWRDIHRHDSATWKQGLLPEGPVAVPALTSTPLLLEVDTAGRIIRSLPLK